MGEGIKTRLMAIMFVLSLLITGCSSTTAPEAERDTSAKGTVSEVPASAPVEQEDRLYEQAIEADEEKEQLKKRKSGDDDMERLD